MIQYYIFILDILFINFYQKIDKLIRSWVSITFDQMLSIYKDLFSPIGEYLSNREKILLTATCKILDSLKYSFVYRDKVLSNKIIHLPYKHNFRYVTFATAFESVPDYVTHLEFTNMYSIPDYINIPSSVTSVKFHRHFSGPINGLPKFIARLNMGNDFNAQIDKLPTLLRRLKLGHFFNKPMDNLPESLTHLEVGYYFNQQIDNLPKSLTHLSIGTPFD